MTKNRHKTEKTGRREGESDDGGVMCAVICCVCPGCTVKEVSLKVTPAERVERGTGPPAKAEAFCGISEHVFKLV